MPGFRSGTIRATVLIETITAAFEMDEILYELRDHSAGLNCGRWDYIFSFIKKFRNRSGFILPQRGDVTMQQPFLRSYVELLIHTCHKRGIHAMGGMAAQIPIRDDPKANEEAMQRVREDKLREVHAGHDGTWVAHPGLVPVAQQVFDEHMPGKNQILPPAEGSSRITAENLIELPKGHITEFGLRRNIEVALRYIESWLRGNGCVPIYNLMEDAATAEICRAQLWQWIRYGATLDDGRVVSSTLFETMIREIVESIQKRQLAAMRSKQASSFGPPKSSESSAKGSSANFSQPRRLKIYHEVRIDRALCRRYPFEFGKNVAPCRSSCPILQFSLTAFPLLNVPVGATAASTFPIATHGAFSRSQPTARSKPTRKRPAFPPESAFFPTAGC